MDQTLDSNVVQEMNGYYQDDTFEDMPLSDELLGIFGMSNELPNGFGMEIYPATTPGGLPSPNSSNPDLPGSGRQSPLLPSVSTFSGVCGSQPSDGSLEVDIDFFASYLPQPSQDSCATMGSDTSKTHPSTNRNFSNESQHSPKAYMQPGEPSMTGSSFTNAGQYQTFTVPTDGPLCNSNDFFQDHAATGQSNESFEEIAPIGGPMSTQVLIAPKVVNNTSSASAAANSQHSPPSRSQHSERQSSHLRNQIHPGLQQDSLFAFSDSANQAPHAMSSRQNFINHQEPSASPSRINHQNVQHPSTRGRYRRITSADSQNRGSPVSQNYGPFKESSLRTSVTSSSLQNDWEAGQFHTTQCRVPQPIFQQQANSSPYMGHHHVSGPEGNPVISYSPEQYLVQSNDSRDVSFMGQGQTHSGFNGSSPMGRQREVSSSDSDYVVPTSNLNGQMASSKSQKKRRVKQESRNHNDDEVAIDPVALQTADLTSLTEMDHTNVMTLINAMHNTENVEDNVGMQKTWDKVRKTKAFRIREVCVELLRLTKQAQRQKGSPLGEKRPINQYTSFEKRFEALRETLTSQKTVCKHLIEPPYSYGVVDDPQYAKDRVKNNRRVNHQKAEAIRLGREHLGEKAQGKGRPMLKTRKREQSQIDESEDEENSGDEPLSDGETDASPHALGSKPARSNPHTPKRTKRSTDSSQHQEQRDSAQPSYLPQVQNVKDHFAHGPHRNAYAPTQQTQMPSEYDQMLQGLAANQQMPTLNQRYGFHSGDESRNSFYGDISTGGSDSEGLGVSSYGQN